MRADRYGQLKCFTRICEALVEQIRAQLRLDPACESISKSVLREDSYIAICAVVARLCNDASFDNITGQILGVSVLVWLLPRIGTPVSMLFSVNESGATLVTTSCR